MRGTGVFHVTAVVLTYNRRDLVQECLHAIMNQIRQCDAIIVVNNASTDGTNIVLKQFEAAGVQIHELPTNIGAAGGFSTAIKLAYSSGTDFIWVMDDDVIVDPHALSELLKAYSILEEAAANAPFVISNAQTIEGLATNVPEIARRTNSLGYQTWPDFLARGMVPVSRATFVSVLFPRETITRYGLPISDMFIWGEDTEYTLRVTRQHPGYFVSGSNVKHIRATSGAPEITNETDAVRVMWHTYKVRNAIYIAKKYNGISSAIRYVLRSAILSWRLFSRNDLVKSLAIARGVFLGLLFNPEVEVFQNTPKAKNKNWIFENMFENSFFVLMGREDRNDLKDPSHG